MLVISHHKQWIVSHLRAAAVATGAGNLLVWVWGWHSTGPSVESNEALGGRDPAANGGVKLLQLSAMLWGWPNLEVLGR